MEIYLLSVSMLKTFRVKKQLWYLRKFNMVSFWDYLFSGAMLIFGGVFIFISTKSPISLHQKHPLIWAKKRSLLPPREQLVVPHSAPPVGQQSRQKLPHQVTKQQWMVEIKYNQVYKLFCTWKHLALRILTPPKMASLRTFTPLQKNRFFYPSIGGSKDS